MKSACGLAIVFLGIVTGCAHTSTLYLDRQDTSFARTVAKIQKISHEDDVDIVFVSGERTKGREIVVGADSKSWLAGDSSLVKISASVEIKSISRVDRLRGAGEGAGLGILTGVAIGGLVYYRGEHGGGHPDFSGLDIPAGGILGGLLGTLGGVAIGSHDEFVFKRKE